METKKRKLNLSKHEAAVPAADENTFFATRSMIGDGDDDDDDEANTTTMVDSMSEERVEIEKQNALMKEIYEHPRQNYCIIGAAGTGKTYFLRRLYDYLMRKQIKVAVCATTGAAAAVLQDLLGEIEGACCRTLHSWSCCRLCDRSEQGMHVKRIQQTPSMRRIRTLIVDEMGMLSGQAFDYMSETVSKGLRHSVERPFGGKQVILFGDPYQLPAVDGTVIFETRAWHYLRPRVVELKRGWRYKNEAWKQALAHMRLGRLSMHEMRELFLPRMYARRAIESLELQIHRARNADILSIPSSHASSPAAVAVATTPKSQLLHTSSSSSSLPLAGSTLITCFATSHCSGGVGGDTSSSGSDTVACGTGIDDITTTGNTTENIANDAPDKKLIFILHIFTTKKEAQQYTEYISKRFLATAKTMTYVSTYDIFNRRRNKNNDGTTLNSFLRCEMARVSRAVAQRCKEEFDTTLKVGSQVMVTRNHDCLFNGMLGYVVTLEKDYARIRIKNGSLQEVHAIKHEYKYDKYHTVRVTYVPLVMAYGVTAHKIQGATLDKCVVTLKNLFSPAHAYTMLSRVPTPKQLFIMSDIRSKKILLRELNMYNKDGDRFYAKYVLE